MKNTANWTKKHYLCGNSIRKCQNRIKVLSGGKKMRFSRKMGHFFGVIYPMKATY